MPFGGYKQSGLGRNKGEYALDNYTQVGLRFYAAANVACARADQSSVTGSVASPAHELEWHVLQVKAVYQKLEDPVWL